MTSALAVAFRHTQLNVRSVISAPLRRSTTTTSGRPRIAARGDGLGRLGSLRREAGRFHGVDESLHVAAVRGDEEHVDVSVRGQRTSLVSPSNATDPEFAYARSSRSRTCGSLDPAFAMPRLKMYSPTIPAVSTHARSMPRPSSLA